ncbi:alpha/beta hydrolase family esterase [Pedobacter miscanthi]|uniref:alpha/beta hydrolase family esterase n=1 Tax=Pedobacter miscanthi TaxID=2259170 RepID=UPI00292D003B|nr:dienelactone hydrolase family protein [Pedobacter miscanthi]
MIIILSILGCLILLGFVAFMYLFYVPSPEKPALGSNIHADKITIGNRERSFLSYVPQSLPKNSNPGLIIVLHGAGIDGAKIREWTGYEFDQMADGNGFIVLYPDGYKNNWNDTRKTASYPAKKENIDDVGFIKALIEKYESTNGIDPLKVYAFGYSNGGEMAYRLAIEEPNLLRAITTVSANLPTADNFNAKISEVSTRIMMVNGTKDPIVPYNGGKIFLFGQDFGKVISAPATAETFAKASQAVKENKSIRLAHQDEKDKSSVDRLVWMKNGQPVIELYTVNGGGHIIPQQVAKMPRFLGKITSDLDAPKEAVKFFNLIKK